MFPADAPKLPKWPFLLGDAALLGLAWFVAGQSRNAIAGLPLIVIVACVALGAILAAVPFLADYARRQDEALDERQRALEALSRTVAASAEQISIAANGLHEITELAQRNLKAAEQLPAKLQEKIAGLKNQLDAARDDEREELKRELARLRASEGERLHANLEKIARTTADWIRLEGSIRQHLAAATETLALAAKASARPEPVEESRPEPAEAARLEPAEQAGADPVERAADAPRRQRKLRATPPAPEAAATPVPPTEEPPPVTSPIPEIVPVAPDSAAPIPATPADSSAAPPVTADPPSAKADRRRAPKKPRSDSPPAETPQPPEPILNLGDAPPSPEPVERIAEVAERVVSSDGATRLLVTAYIGIGNRLFIRGSGPGLSWDKGVPLQFVSIGKWRWESHDATAPVQFKLYKNDDTECAALGAQTLEPGRQGEMTATF
jgi:hypothetical protein